MSLLFSHHGRGCDPSTYPPRYPEGDCTTTPVQPPPPGVDPPPPTPPLPDPEPEPEIPVTPSCGSVLSSGGETGTDWEIRTVELGTDIGVVVLEHNAVSIPDRYKVYWDGNLVIETGFVSNQYPDGSQLSNYNYQLNSLGYPSIVGTSPGIASFNKTTAWPTTADVHVQGPLGGTVWHFTLHCPVPEPIPCHPPFPCPSTELDLAYQLVHFDGGFVIPPDHHQPFSGGNFVEYLGVGDYPEAFVSLSSSGSFNGTLDTIYVPSGLRLEFWTGLNFTGFKVLEVCGPKAIWCHRNGYMEDNYSDKIFGTWPEPWESMFPVGDRFILNIGCPLMASWVIEGWDHQLQPPPYPNQGSFKISLI